MPRLVVIAVLTAAAGFTAVTLPATAAATCALDDGVLRIESDPEDAVGGAGVKRGAGPEIVANDANSSCDLTGPTVDNVDSIVFSDPVPGRSTNFGIGASFSPATLLAPGRTPEGDGTSEIELFVDLGGDPGDIVDVSAGFGSQSGPFEIAQDDLVLIGQRGETVLVDLNAAQEPPVGQDADLSIDGIGGLATGDWEDGYLRIQTLTGTDVVRARGGPQLGGVVTAPLYILLQPGAGDKAVLGDGPDRLVGTGDANVLKTKGGADTIRAGGGRDKINPGKGKDEVEGGPGNDLIRARDGKRDVIDCGAGKRDKVIADRKDRVKRCKKVVRRR